MRVPRLTALPHLRILSHMSILTCVVCILVGTTGPRMMTKGPAI